MIRASRSIVRPLFYAAIPLLLLLNVLVFPLFGLSYLRWYIENGAQISAGVLLGVLAWDRLAGHHDLISRNPADYVAASVYAAGTAMRDIGTEVLLVPNDRTDRNNWDLLATILLLAVVAGVIAAWVIVVAPLNYFVTLFAGAPARLFRQRATRSSDPQQTARLGSDPLALTQAFSALLLVIAELGWDRLG